MKHVFIVLFTSYLVACGGSPAPKTTDTPAPPEPTTACGPAKQAEPISSGGEWQLVWADEFDGSVIDNSKWQHEVNCAGGGNNELQCYTDAQANSFVENGLLHIVGVKQAVSGNDGWDGKSGNNVTRNYSSARLRTLGLADWRYGRFEIRAKLPFGQGMWPAIWMLPAQNSYGGWPLDGEIDIMETVNLRTNTDNSNRLHGYLHYSDAKGQLKSSGNSIIPSNDLSTNFHTFAVEWEAGEIRWYIDDVLYSTQRQTEWMTCGGAIKEGVVKTDSAPFDQNFHLLLNLAIGGEWPGSPDSTTQWPQTFQVDYVRVYQCLADTITGHGCTSNKQAQKPLVVGYLPAYKGLADNIGKIGLDQLSHVNLSFLNPNSDGELIVDDTLLCMPSATTTKVSGTEIRTVVEQAHEAGVKVSISVGGGVIPHCAGDWDNLLQVENRQALIDKLLQVVDDFNLDGLDIDLEGALLTQIDNAGNYTPFIQALSAQLKKRGKLLTTATASYVGGMVPESSVPYFDFVYVMSYDAIGPSWGQAGTEHSSYQMAVEHLKIWQQRGVSKDKLVLGLPFYGYGFGSYASDYSFNDIVSQFGQDATNQDLIGTACIGCSYITYNGINTIRAKTALALQEGAGVMIWEVTQDASAGNSLLKTITSQIQNIKNSP